MEIQSCHFIQIYMLYAHNEFLALAGGNFMSWSWVKISLQFRGAIRPESIIT